MSRNRTTQRGISIVTLIVWPVVIGGVLLLGWQLFGWGMRSPTTITSAGPRLEEVRTIAKLAVLRVQVADVIEGSNRGARGIVLVKGDADVAVDLEHVEVVDCNADARTATIVLGRPRPERPRVDHARTRIYELEETGLAAWNPFADPRRSLLEDCMSAAQESVANAVDEPEYIARAQAEAETLLKSFYRELGWDVAIRWR